MLRRQLPVYSPVTWSAVAGGFVTTLGGPSAGVAGRIAELLKSRYLARNVLLTDSGTSALRLALSVGAADRALPVALPGYACYDLATAAEGADARVLLYDMDPRTIGPDFESLRAVAKAGPRAIVLAHPYGYPVDLAAVRDVVGDAMVIEDAAQGAGGRLGGRLLGSFGSLSILSFGRGKGMTGGAGGALLAHDDRGQAIVEEVGDTLGLPHRGFSETVALAAQLVLGRPWIYGLPASLPFLHLGETVHHEPWSPRAPSPASLTMLERLVGPSDRERVTRSTQAKRLGRSLENSPIADSISIARGGEPGYLRLPALVRAPRSGSIRASTMAPLGITRMYPKVLAELPRLASRLAGAVPELRGSVELRERLITLPTHGLLAEGDLKAIERWLVVG